MDSFVKDAFKQAVENEQDREFGEYKNRIADRGEQILTGVGLKVGLDAMNEISRLVIHSGQAFVLGEFIKGVMIVAFHEGYQAGRESE